MLIISKKKIIINLTYIVCLCIAIIYFIKGEKINNILETSNHNIINKRIIIDAGHGKPDGGAVAVNGVFESDINLKIALKVKDLLENIDAKVILTRKDENSIADKEIKNIREKKKSDIKKRVKIGNNSSADIFVSIHLNKIAEEKYKGWQTFYKDNDQLGKNLAYSIQEGLNKSIKKENNRVPLKIDNIYMLKHINIPIVIVECGFLSNIEENRQLQQDEYQNKLAYGIFLGIKNYFEDNK